MKKIIAVLLCMATVCTCVACGGSKETERTKKTKKTKDTTETEETDVPTDTTASDTSESETETETSAPDNKDFVITHDLSAFEIKKTRDLMMYGAVDATGDPDLPYSLKSVEVGYDILETTDTTSSIPRILEEYVHHTGQARSAQFEQKLNQFNDLVNSGSPLFSYWFYENCYILRSDSQVFSMQVDTYGYATDEDIDPKVSYSNFDSMSGVEIQMDDVILDRGAFALYVEQYFNSIGAAKYATIADIHDQINDGSLTFGMTYDGIWVNEIKVPVAGHGDIFNMKYFGSTPKNYTLEFDMQDELVWDFDGDGSLDQMKLETIKSSNNYSVETLKITYLGQEYTFKASEYDEMDDMEDLDRYNGSHVMSVDGKNYLLVSMDCEGEDQATYIFDINGSEPKFVEVFFSTPKEALDPTHFTINLRTDIIGTLFMKYDFALGADGHLQQLSSVGRCNGGPLLTQMPLPGKEYNVATNTAGADTEIPGGAIVEILGYDNKSGLLITRVHPKYLNMDTMDIALETDKVSTIAGQPRDTAFIGINYAD